MQNNQKMKFEVFIHNDEVSCFHVVVQGTQTVVVMGRHNFKDELLIKRWQVGKKMNGTCRKLKDENKQRVTIESCFHLLQEVVCFFKVLEFKVTLQ